MSTALWQLKEPMAAGSGELSGGEINALCKALAECIYCVIAAGQHNLFCET
jgi:hypothetical protein